MLVALSYLSTFVDFWRVSTSHYTLVEHRVLPLMQMIPSTAYNTLRLLCVQFFLPIATTSSQTWAKTRQSASDPLQDRT